MKFSFKPTRRKVELISDLLQYALLEDDSILYKQKFSDDDFMKLHEEVLLSILSMQIENKWQDCIGCWMMCIYDGILNYSNTHELSISFFKAKLGFWSRFNSDPASNPIDNELFQAIFMSFLHYCETNELPFSTFPINSR